MSLAVSAHQLSLKMPAGGDGHGYRLTTTTTVAGPTASGVETHATLDPGHSQASHFISFFNALLSRASRVLDLLHTNSSWLRVEPMPTSKESLVFCVEYLSEGPTSQVKGTPASLGCHRHGGRFCASRRRGAGGCRCGRR